MPGTNRWPTTPHSPRRSISAFRPQQCPSAVSAGPTAEAARDDRGAHCRTQRHEDAEYRTEQNPAACGQDRARDEQRAEDSRHNDVGQRRRGTCRQDHAPHLRDVDHPRDGYQVEHPE